MKIIRIISVTIFILLSLSTYSFAQSKLPNIEDPSIIPKNARYILFTRDTCGFCPEFEESLSNVLDIVNIDNSIAIYKFDTDELRQHKDFNKTLDLYSIKGVPALIHIHNDVVISRFSSQEEDKDGIESDLLQYFYEGRVFNKTKNAISYGYIFVCIFSALLLLQIYIYLKTDRLSISGFLKLTMAFTPIILIKIIVWLMYYEADFSETYGLEMPTQNFFYAIVSIVLCILTIVILLIKQLSNKLKGDKNNV